MKTKTPNDNHTVASHDSVQDNGATFDGTIGLFDSGIGGLSIATAVQNTLPKASLIYVADHAHAPYGRQAERIVLARSTDIVQWLIGQKVEAIVVACNTATVMAIGELRRKTTAIPIIGVEPGIKPAIKHLQSCPNSPVSQRKAKIAVLATTNTVKGQGFRRLITQHAGQNSIILQPCPGFAELVESGQWHSPAAQQQVSAIIKPLIKAGVRTFVLGCTHYSFLKPLIEQVAQTPITLIDTSEAVAQQVRRRLTPNKTNLAVKAPHTTMPHHIFYSTRTSSHIENTARQLWPNLNQTLALSL